jgi:hypothetical protein
MDSLTWSHRCRLNREKPLRTGLDHEAKAVTTKLGTPAIEVEGAQKPDEKTRRLNDFIAAAATLSLKYTPAVQCLQRLGARTDRESSTSRPSDGEVFDSQQARHPERSRCSARPVVHRRSSDSKPLHAHGEGSRIYWGA